MYDWQVMAADDLAAITGEAYGQQVAPDGTQERKLVTFVGLQSSAYQMIDSLCRHEDGISHLIQKVVLLAPTIFMDLPGPSFVDPVMDQIKDLFPPYVGGNFWRARRTQICEKPGNEELCAHPFMAEDLEFPFTVFEWELLQQQAEAKGLQDKIPREDHKEKG